MNDENVNDYGEREDEGVEEESRKGYERNVFENAYTT